MKKAFIIFTVLVLCIGSLFAGYYESGDTEFSFRAGVTVPALQYFPFRTENKIFVLGGINDEIPALHMSKIGGFGSLTYQVFLSKQFMLGGEAGYNFVKSSEDLYLAVIPFTAKFSYVPVQNGKFDLNLHANAGVALLKYKSHRFFPAPYISASVNPVFFITDNWGIGAETGFWSALEFYTAQERKDYNCVTAAIPLTLTVTYRH